MSRATKNGSITARALFTDTHMRGLGSRGATTLHHLDIHTPSELATFLSLPDALETMMGSEFVGIHTAREIWRTGIMCAQTSGTDRVPPFPEKQTRKRLTQMQLADQPDLPETVRQLAGQVNALATLLCDLTEQHHDLCRRVDHFRSERGFPAAIDPRISDYVSPTATPAHV